MPDPKRSYDVIIIGAGIAGLTAAAYLSRYGLHVLVSEQAVGIDQLPLARSPRL